MRWPRPSFQRQMPCEGAVVCVGMTLSGVRARLVITPVKHSQSVRGRRASVDTAQPH